MRSLRAFLILAAVGWMAACADGEPGTPLAGAPEAPRTEVRTGFVFGPGGEPMQVRYSVVDGRGLLEGDIDLGPVDGIARTREELVNAARAGADGPRFGAIIWGQQYRWPSGDVAYVIDASVPNPQRVLDAIAHIETKAPGINYHPRNGHTDYVRIVNGTSANDCRAVVGRAGGAQNLWLGANCTLGNTIHELLHAAGMWHEQSRCDRDNYVTILWDNLESTDARSNFDVHCTTGIDGDFYNEASIMHYSSTAFGRLDAFGNRMQTIVSKRGLEYLMGQRQEMKSSDVFSIHYMYPPPQLRVRIVAPSTTVRVGGTYTWTSDVYENGPATTYAWYRDRVPVSTGYSYTGSVPSLSQFELMLKVTNAAGEEATAVTYVYPSP